MASKIISNIVAIKNQIYFLVLFPAFVLTGCLSTQEDFQATGVIIKRDLADCPCCPTQYNLVRDPRGTVVADLVVQQSDSSTHIHSLPDDFALEDSNLPLRVQYTYDFINDCANSVRVTKAARLFDEVKSPLKKGSLHNYIDSIRIGNRNTIFGIADTAVLANNGYDNIFKTDTIQIYSIMNAKSTITDAGTKPVTLPASTVLFKLKNHNNFHFKPSDENTFQYQINWDNNQIFNSKFCAQKEGDLFFTKIDSTQKLISGRYVVKVCSEARKDSMMLEGFFYRIKVRFSE